ncbi:MAG: universal stress protein [bacterium]
MFKEIYVPFDNSPHSIRALELGVALARKEEATLVGSHVYAAKLHDWRFRALESGLPEQFRKENELERQRVIHDSLITSGLELITDSYLVVMGRRCEEAGVPFRGVSLEGRNWQGLVKDISAQHYDLVVMGALGLGRTPESLVGTVCERVVRRVEADVLVVRSLEPVAPDAPIVVCLDGSERAWGGFDLALHLSGATGRPVMAVAAFDPYFHYTLFDSLKSALTNEAKEVFKFEQQERLHEEIIDSGLAKIYQSHLEIAVRLAKKEGHDIQTRLLDGKPAEKLIQLSREAKPWLMIMGRTGIHGGEEMDLGGVAENLLRQSSCDLLLTHRAKRPPDEYVAEATTAWSEEGRARLELAPVSVRGVAMAAIQRFAIAEGYTMITSGVVDQALEQILPFKARISMGITKPGVDSAAPEKEYLTLSYGCASCSYVHRQRRPEVCPVCGERGTLFRVVSGGEEAGEEDLVREEAFDGRMISWAHGALELLEAVPDYFLRKRTRHRIEKKARTQNLAVISTAFASEAIGGHNAGNGNGESGRLQGGSGTAAPESGPAPLEEEVPVREGWSEGGWRRLLKAPEGFMREQALEYIEAYAREAEAAEITSEIAEAGMAQAREKMMEAMEKGQL